MDTIINMRGYIQSRKKKGKTAKQVASDLENRGYDHHASRGLVMLHWHDEEDKEFSEYVEEKIGGGLE